MIPITVPYHNFFLKKRPLCFPFTRKRTSVAQSEAALPVFFIKIIFFF